MKKSIISLIALIQFASGCATSPYTYRDPLYAESIEQGSVLRHLSLDQQLEERILGLNPEKVTDNDIRETLSHAPAPRIINIHGGIYPVHLAMKSFSQFLIGMGYPEAKTRSPKDGDYSYSCYENSEKLAGIIAWYYEREGMRPMIIGHSQGGIQAVKVLHELSGAFNTKLLLYNPITDTTEDSYILIDPLTGTEQPVVGTQASYATAVGSGGLSRLMPNQWSMIDLLRKIPDTVVEFTGFYMELDILGGDFFGYGFANNYTSGGKAVVRNVLLPMGYNHVTVPVTKHLARSRETKEWINRYTPSERPILEAPFESSSDNILWAADVWYSIKKHWVLELQRLIKAKRALKNVR